MRVKSVKCCVLQCTALSRTRCDPCLRQAGGARGGQWAGRGRGKSISCSQECVIGIQMDSSDSLMLLRLSVIVKW